MRIAYVPGVFFPDPGGAQVQAHNLANIMNKNPIKADILLLNKSNIRYKNYNILYFNKILINLIYILNYYFGINIKFILKKHLKKIKEEKEYNVWHFIFLNYKTLLIIDALYEIDKNIIVTFQGADIQINKKISYGNRLDEKYNKLLKSVIPKIKFFTAISYNIYNDLLKLGIKNKKIILIPNGVPLKKFIKYRNISQSKKSKILKLITVARYAEKKKGFDLIPLVLSKLIKFKINFEWTIIGKNTNQIFKNKIVNLNKKKFRVFENLNIEKEYFFPSKKIINEYLKSDLYINLSRIESFGITFVEALSANVPVITFNTKGAKEIVINNFNGFIIKKKKFDNFCSKIKKISKNKSYFKMNPFKSANKYDLNKLKNNYLKLYQLDL